MTNGVPKVGFSRPVVVDRVVVMTISVMAALIIYDGWERLRFVDVVAIVVGPIVAIFASHLFAGDLALRVELGRRVTRRERLALAHRESRFLFLALPPLTLLCVLTVLGVAYARTIQIIILTGIVALGLCGGIAGRQAGLTGWRLIACVGYGLALGILTLVLQAVLQPGTNPFQP